jgi:hypothetical protein
MGASAILAATGTASSPFVPAPRYYSGNMCGVRVAGLPAVDGGGPNPSLVLSWFIDRYRLRDRLRIYDTWKAKQQLDVLVSWPDSRAVGASPFDFVQTCQELKDNGFRPFVFLSSKVYDPWQDVPGILANIAPVLQPLINAGVAPRISIGWELGIDEWLTPANVRVLIDMLAPPCVAAGIKVYIHLQPGYGDLRPQDTPTQQYFFKDFWNPNQGLITGLFHQKIPEQTPDEYRFASGGLHDILDRFAGNFGVVPDSGFGHPFDCIAGEIGASQEFAGTMTEAEGDVLGRWAINTPAVNGPLGPVSVMGSGNGA